ncbi:FtsW/RodA/SpoVE family cell cycle protein [Alteribacillus sp. HJP-4]|uniref:FtsW/RodA/SpoVE family cell cycle protein n=1 Tax=Alteribacillus sp. HJP-4 TaxID=2775394 RepID=UPI0035CCCE6E
MENIKYEKYDINMFFVLFLFSVISCLSIFYAQEMSQYDTNFVIRQAVFYFVAFLMIFLILHFDFEYYMYLSWLLYFLGLFLLMLLAIAPPSIAPPSKGAVRWFELPLIGSFQPSELMKIFIIITLSNITFKHNQRYSHTLSADLKLIGKMTVVVIPPVLFLVNQPDMGMVMMTTSIFITMLIVSGVSLKILAVLFGIPLLGIAMFLWVFFRYPAVIDQYIFSYLSPYQVRRFYGWLNPFEYVDEGYQTAQALLLIGTGKVFGSDHQIYIPEAHTDFIFAIIGNTHGFGGAALLIVLYFILLYMIVMTAFKCHHPFGSYLCAGIAGMLAFQVFQNIGMNLGILPVTGFTLPLVSYGGSSLLTTMLAIGLVMGVRYNRKVFMFSSSDSQYKEKA